MKAEQDVKYTQETLERDPVTNKNLFFLSSCLCMFYLPSLSVSQKHRQKFKPN